MACGGDDAEGLGEERVWLAVCAVWVDEAPGSVTHHDDCDECVRESKYEDGGRVVGRDRDEERVR